MTFSKWPTHLTITKFYVLCTSVSAALASCVPIVASCAFSCTFRMAEGLCDHDARGVDNTELALKDEGELSGVSDESDCESDYSQSTMLTGGSGSTRLSREDRVKKKHLKKKLKKDVDGPRRCYSCGSTTEDPDLLVEHHRRMQAHAGAAGVKLPAIKTRWAKRKMNGKPEGDRCYLCHRTVRAKLRWASMKPKDFKKKMKESEPDRKDFADDKVAVTATLACLGVNADLKEMHTECASEVFNIEQAGEETAREGLVMLETKFNEKYTEAERKKLNVKKDTRFNLVTRKEESIIRIFDEEEGVERFRQFQRKAVEKRTRLADKVSEPEELDNLFTAVATAIGRPTNTKGFLTAADIKFANLEKENLSKAERQKKSLKRNNSESSESSGSVAPLLEGSAGARVADAKNGAKRAKLGKGSSASASTSAGASRPSSVSVTSSVSVAATACGSSLSGHALCCVVFVVRLTPVYVIGSVCDSFQCM